MFCESEYLQLMKMQGRVLENGEISFSECLQISNLMNKYTEIKIMKSIYHIPFKQSSDCK